MQEVDDFGEGLLGFVLTGHIPEGDAGGPFHVHLGVGLAHAADAADAAHAALFRHPVHGQGDHEQEEDKGHHITDEDGQDGVHGGLIGLAQGNAGGFAAGGDGIAALRGDTVEVIVRLIGGPGLRVLVHIPLHRGDDQGALGAVHLDLTDLALLQQIQEICVPDLRGAGVTGGASQVIAGIADDDGQQRRPAQQEITPRQLLFLSFLLFLLSFWFMYGTPLR